MSTTTSPWKKKVYEYGILSSKCPKEVAEDPLLSKLCMSCCAAFAQRNHRQSPIDIVEKNSKYQEFRPFTFTGFENISLKNGTLKAWNTGGTLKLLAEPGVAMLGGGPLNVPYEFVEMHFHWGDASNPESNEGSEHKINGKSYPLELHMVHKNLHDETIDDALSHENGLCVLAFVFDIVDYDVAIPGLDNLAEIVQKHLIKSGSIFDQKAEKEDVCGSAHPDVVLANFIPFLVDEYFTYRGSLTTGGSEEAVN